MCVRLVAQKDNNGGFFMTNTPQNSETNGTCCCAKAPAQKPGGPFNTKVYFAKLILIALVWWAAYSQTLSFSQWMTYDVFGLTSGTQGADALEFFIYDSLKILLLLVAMVYGIAWIRVSISVDKIRKLLSGRNRFVSYLMGAGFGAVTPFCSCSSVPLFIGFTSARIPLGATMAFLITSPLINEIAIVILWGLLGWKFTIVYVVVGMLAGIVGGFIMDSLNAERWLQPFLLEKAQNLDLALQSEDSGQPEAKPNIAERHMFAAAETLDIFRRVWLWVVIGVGVGAALHGYVPQEWITDTLGKGQWWSVPVAVAIGIPLYTNVTGIIPVMESLLRKGLPLGTTLALCMSTTAISLPEILMLKQVMRFKLLALFIGLMLVIFTIVGWFFNAINFTIL